MKWPPEFYAQLDGSACPLCDEGRPDETAHGVRFFAGEVADAYLVRADIQRALHTHLLPRYADDPRPGWPFPFPEQDPPPMPDERLRADVESLRRATR
ncbi:MAG TPA: hypothetical protein VKB28_17615 [Solirubrobacteraceae bacterium]|nr:hypothetical protein [Solirubrobacteraceae bacterium]